MTNRYQSIVVLLYLSVFLATIIYVLVLFVDVSFLDNTPFGRPRSIPRPNGIILFSFGICLLLVILEKSLDNQTIDQLPFRIAIGHLAIRFVLVVAAILIIGLPFTVYLFYPIFLFTFFAFSKWAANLTALMTSVFVGWHASTYSLREFFNLTDLNNLIVFLLGTFLVLLLANALQVQHQTSQNLHKANNELAESHEKLSQYAAQVATLAAADERNRLARDIHDSLGHHLMATSIQLEKAIAYRSRDEAIADEALNHARRTIRDVLGEVRLSVHSLRESQERFELEPSLGDLTKRMSNTLLTPKLKISGNSASYSTFAKMTLYRIVQEALTNIHKHANASEALVDLNFSDQEAKLIVQDNGNGFNNAAQPIFDSTRTSKNGHYGLQGIQERVALVGGNISIDSSLNQGTILSVVIPYQNGSHG